jgi:hypothetical protein
LHFQANSQTLDDKSLLQIASEKGNLEIITILSERGILNPSDADSLFEGSLPSTHLFIFEFSFLNEFKDWFVQRMWIRLDSLSPAPQRQMKV